MKTKKLLKKIATKSLRHCWHKNKLLFINISKSDLDLRHVKCGRHVHHENVVVQQPSQAER